MIKISPRLLFRCAGKKVRLYRYVDPLLGPRKIPVPDMLGTGRLAEMSDTDSITFQDESTESDLMLMTRLNGAMSKLELGSELLYIVEL